MKTKLLSATLLALQFSAALVAAPLATTTAVHTKPDSTSPAISFLKAGTEPVAVANALATTPAGWLAIELPGPFEGYVENKDLAKSLDVKPGSPIRLAPKADAGVLALAAAGDKIEITGLRGKWTQISLQKSLTGYIHIGSTPGYLPPIATTPAAPKPAAPAPVAASPVTPSVYGVATPGQASPMLNLGDGGSTTLPRQFAGKFVSTRRAFAPRRPFDYALEDDAGKRYAYVDISKLLLTEQIEKYIDRHVVVFGTARNAPDAKDIVITIETLQLR